MATETPVNQAPTEGSLPSPQPVESQAPAASPAPVEPAAPVIAAPEAPAAPHPAEVPSLLEKFDAEKKSTEEVAKPVESVKPEDKPKPIEDKSAKPEEVKPSEPPKPEEQKAQPDKPVEYKFELPTSIKADVPEMADFTNILRESNTAPEVGQKYLNLHAKAMENFAKETFNNQVKAFNETRSSWQKEVMSDPDLGGSGHETAMGVVARMRDLLVPEADRPAFDQFLRITGAGDHPQFLKVLLRAGRYFDEAAPGPSNLKPPPDIGKNPNTKGARLLYDNPRSTPSR